MNTVFHPIRFYTPHEPIETDAHVWSYWDGDLADNSLIDYCLQSISRHNPTHRVVTPNTLVTIPGGQEALDFVEGYCKAHQADYIRLFLLDTFGGVWLDSDCLAFRPLETFNLQGEQNMFVVGGASAADEHVYASPLGVKKGTPEIEFMLHVCRKRLLQKRQGAKLRWSATANIIYAEMLHSGKWDIKEVQKWQYQRLKCGPLTTALKSRPKPQNVHRAVGAAAQILHIGGCKPHFRKLNHRQQLGQRTVMGLLFRRALGLPEAMEDHVLECYLRLRDMEGQCVRAVEVGVLRGGNALSWLDLPETTVEHVALVDTWGPPTESYRKSCDDIVKLMEQQGQEIYEGVCKAAREFVDAGRATILRVDAAEGASEFEDGSIDFCFIDADHSEEGCSKDIAAWYPKIKPGGWLGGHDYFVPKNRWKWGVVPAVNQFVGAEGLELVRAMGTTWWVQKP